uniref:DOP1 leucine zipper like protein B n=1 Tax=Labrus bergylta TaxID=56723 RepID=A0A3Q3EVP0_9LABR
MDAEELELQNDYRYRNYASVIEKALRNFESSSEWADLISSLGKLNKALQSNLRYSLLPKRLIIGKRLAPVSAPSSPERRSPQGAGDLRGHFQNHWYKMAGQGFVHLLRVVLSVGSCSDGSEAGPADPVAVLSPPAESSAAQSAGLHHRTPAGPGGGTGGL